MTAIQTPDNGLSSPAPVNRSSWTKGAGLKKTYEWTGSRTNVAAQFDALVAEGEAGGTGLAQIDYVNDHGRAQCIARYARTETGAGELGFGDDVVVVEELYSVDLLRDLKAAPYFVSGAGALTDDEAAFVALCVEERLTEPEINALAGSYGISASLAYTSWTNAMKSLRGHMTHGQEYYIENAFILRRTLYGARTSQMAASFVGMGTIVVAPTFTTPMSNLIKALPTGEWLKKPPQVEHLKGGRNRVVEEWHYATQWSVVYGTLGTYTGL